jgi:hypothetical protein
VALTAWQALMEAKPHQGQRVLVLAASGGRLWWTYSLSARCVVPVWVVELGKYGWSHCGGKTDVAMRLQVAQAGDYSRLLSSGQHHS